MKDLIFFTSQFPFGQGETFIENELPFLARAFKTVVIVTNDGNSSLCRSIPSNVQVIRIPASAPFRYKVKALSAALNPVIRQELSFIQKRLKLTVSRSVLSILFGGYAEALYTADRIEDIINKYKLVPQSLVLYSYWMNNSAAAIAIYKKNNPAVTSVCRAHGWDVYFERHSPPYLPLRNFIAGNLDYCCCISENGKQYFENLLQGKTKDNILVSRLGTFNKTGRRSSPNQGKLVLASCSNIIPLKRVNLIIETLALIHQIDIEWTHFGSGKLENEIKELARIKLNSLNNIKFHFAGQVSNQSLLEYYGCHNIDLFINLSETEGLPVSFMEAGSFGIPVIATIVGGVGEIIKEGLNGLLLDANAQPDEIASKIEAYYTLPEARKNDMRNNALNEWQKNFNAEINYRFFTNLLDNP